MSDNRWLGDQLEQAAQEVQSWDAWKRDAMRREATAISVEKDRDERPSAADSVSSDWGHERHSV
jgi:hypothetical protein